MRKYLDEEKDQLVAFGLRVRSRRLLLNLSQEELAELTDLHRTYVSSVERGERNISLLNITRISAALKVKPSFLVAD